MSVSRGEPRKFPLMKLVVLACLVYVGYQWLEENQLANADYKKAEIRIAKAMTDGRTVLELKGLTHLKALPKSIRKFEKLEWLNVSNTKLYSIAELADLQQLKYVALDNTRVADLAPLANSSDLNEISVVDSWVFDLEPLTGLRRLKRMQINQTELRSLEPATRIVALDWLNLHRSYAHDGSQRYYKSLLANGVEVFNGTAYQQNYIPGGLYKAKIQWQRMKERFDFLF